MDIIINIVGIAAIDPKLTLLVHFPTKYFAQVLLRQPFTGPVAPGWPDHPALRNIYAGMH